MAHAAIVGVALPFRTAEVFEKGGAFLEVKGKKKK